MTSLSLPSKLIRHRKRVQEDFRRTKTHWSPYHWDLYAGICDTSCPFLMVCPFQTLAVDLIHPFPLASHTNLCYLGPKKGRPQYDSGSWEGRWLKLLSLCWTTLTAQGTVIPEFNMTMGGQPFKKQELQIHRWDPVLQLWTGQLWILKQRETKHTYVKEGGD